MFLLRVNSAKLTATSNASASNTSKLELLRDLEPKTLNELLRDDLPRWVKFPDVEKCEWLNKVIAGMWPYAKLLRCERLASMDVNRTLDPYVVFSVGCRTKQSTVKRHTFNPIWDPPESFELLVADYQHDEMSVLVMDSNLLKTDDTVSRVQIGLEPVQRAHRLTDIWLLEGNCGSVTLEPGWRGC
ncbi:hypothetical protein PI126_g10182 [Phytophthora idaei]|nr:hypothetical protein PI126_g10182 [Phytophthora idaei]